MSGTTTGGGIPGEGHEPVILGRGDRNVTITLEDLHTIIAALPDGILKDVLNHLYQEVPTPAAPEVPPVDSGEDSGKV